MRVNFTVNGRPQEADDVWEGESLLYVDSRGRVGIAVNQGNYSKKFSIEPSATIFIPRKSAVPANPTRPTKPLRKP